MAGAYWGSRIKDDAACRYTLDSLEAIFAGGFAEDLAFPLGMWMAGQDMLGYENCRKVRDCAQALSMVFYERGWSELRCVTALMDDGGDYVPLISRKPIPGLTGTCFNIDEIMAGAEQ